MQTSAFTQRAGRTLPTSPSMRARSLLGHCRRLPDTQTHVRLVLDTEVRFLLTEDLRATLEAVLRRDEHHQKTLWIAVDTGRPHP